MAKDESLNNQTENTAFDPKGKPILKSAKNMVGYAEDAAVDSKQVEMGNLIKAYQEKNSGPDNECSDEDIMKYQEDKRKALEAERMKTQS